MQLKTIGQPLCQWNWRSSCNQVPKPAHGFFQQYIHNQKRWPNSLTTCSQAAETQQAAASLVTPITFSHHHSALLRLIFIPRLLVDTLASLHLSSLSPSDWRDGLRWHHTTPPPPFTPNVGRWGEERSKEETGNYKARKLFYHLRNLLNPKEEKR